MFESILLLIGSPEVWQYFVTLVTLSYLLVDEQLLQ